MKNSRCLEISEQQTEFFTRKFKYLSPTLADIQFFLSNFGPSKIDLGWGFEDGFDGFIFLDEIHFIKNKLFLVGQSYYTSPQDYCKEKIYLSEDTRLFRINYRPSAYPGSISSKIISLLLLNIDIPSTISVYMALKQKPKSCSAFVVPIQTIGLRVLTSFGGVRSKQKHTVYFDCLSIWGEVE